jgi:hypothetical protein
MQGAEPTSASDEDTRHKVRAVPDRGIRDPSKEGCPTLTAWPLDAHSRTQRFCVPSCGKTGYSPVCHEMSVEPETPVERTEDSYINDIPTLPEGM